MRWIATVVVLPLSAGWRWAQTSGGGKRLRVASPATFIAGATSVRVTVARGRSLLAIATARQAWRPSAAAARHLRRLALRCPASAASALRPCPLRPPLCSARSLSWPAAWASAVRGRSGCESQGHQEGTMAFRAAATQPREIDAYQSPCVGGCRTPRDSILQRFKVIRSAERGYSHGGRTLLLCAPRRRCGTPGRRSSLLVAVASEAARRTRKARMWRRLRNYVYSRRSTDCSSCHLRRSILVAASNPSSTQLGTSQLRIQFGAHLH